MSENSQLPEKPFRIGHRAMHTEFTVFIAGESPDYASNAARAAFVVLDRLEGKLSRFISSSDISQVNALRVGESFALGAEVWQCLLTASHIAAETGRAFDPAAGALIDFWKTVPAKLAEAASNTEAWQEAWEAHRQGQLSLDSEYQTATCIVEGSKLDLGAVGKGFALDEMARVLEDEWGVSRALLSAGGSTVLALEAPEGKAGWRVGFGGESGLPPVSLKRRALSSSGNHSQPTHLVDSRTGLLVSRAELVRSIAGSGAAADALSTAFYVMSREEVEGYCTSHPDAVALLAQGSEGAQVFDVIGELPPDATWS